MAAPQVLVDMDSIFQNTSDINVIAATTLSFVSGMLTWANFFMALLFGSMLLNFKALPLVYHLRILNAIRFVLKSQKPKEDVKPEQLFQALITSSKAPLMEIDVLGHKSNSTYFADVDIARMHLMITLFARGIEKIRGGTTMNALSRKPPSKLTIALGAVSCTFKKELLPYETYDMWTRILCWDDKWLYVVTHFVKRQPKIKPGKSTLYPQQDAKRPGGKDRAKTPTSARSCDSSSNGSGSGPEKPPAALVAATALSKIVWKNGRLTVRPQEMLEAANLLPHTGDDMDEVEREKLSLAIETERQRGLKLANLLGGQIELHNELNTDVALGSHYDGLGIEGVVSTLGQLGKISPYQLV